VEGGIKTFLRGVVTGAAIMLVFVLIIAALRFFYNRDKRIYELIEREGEIEAIREGVVDRDVYEFLEDPGVRGAADRGIDTIRRKRDEVLQRERSGGDD
jgi:hypothetical protein